MTVTVPAESDELRPPPDPCVGGVSSVVACTAQTPAGQPDFAGEQIAHCRLADSDPPDILCSTVSGRTVGVELGEWLHLAK